MKTIRTHLPVIPESRGNQMLSIYLSILAVSQAVEKCHFS
jgi:hypothetical protein